jgi:hypothetical protein
VDEDDRWSWVHVIQRYVVASANRTAGSLEHALNHCVTFVVNMLFIQDWTRVESLRDVCG